MPPRTSTDFPIGVALPALVSGALMAFYLLARPYGDAHGASSTEAASAFASTMWVATHVAGMGALVAFAILAFIVADRSPRSRLRTLGVWSAVGGAIGVLPYYGAETFALTEIGALALTGEPGVLPLAEAVRDNPVGLVLFAAGLIGLAVAGIATAILWQVRHSGGSAPLRLAMWPLGVLVALVLPQFFLDPTGRMAYGVAFAVAAAVVAVAAYSSTATATAPRRGDIVD